MSESPQQIKDRIASRYLGKAGVHGVGLRLREGALYLYVAPDAPAELADTLTDIRREAYPLKVVLVREEPAFLLR